MKLTNKNIPAFIAFVLLGTLIGSLCWEVLERIIHLNPEWSDFSLTLEKPLTIFDFYVLSISLRANPGTLLGSLGGLIIFFKG